MFNSNTADHYGGSIYSDRNSHLSFQRNSSTVFSSNVADNGGAIASFGNISFQDSSITVFKDNSANVGGGAIYSYGCISFEQNSSTSFRNNLASHGAAIYSYFCNIYFRINSSTTFSNNIADYYGGAIYFQNAYIHFEENSSTVFKNNTADTGGAIYSFSGGVSFADKSSTLFKNNKADSEGGCIFGLFGYIRFEENSSTMFKNNAAYNKGGAIYYVLGTINFKGNSSTMFSNNIANDGGAIYYDDGDISFEENSYTMFSYNTAVEGGAIYMHSEHGHMSFEHSSSTVFSDNVAAAGGAISLWSDINFEGNSKTVFTNNTANEGGAIMILHSNSIYFKGNSNGIFRNNTASSGGSIHSSKGYLHFEETSETTFSLNTAIDGGAIFTGANISFNESSYTLFNNNMAENNGGAIYFHYGSQEFFNSIISFNKSAYTVFSNNNADNNGGAIFTTEKGTVAFSGYSITVFKSNIADYGGALLAKLKSNIIFSDKSTITFTDNRATFGATIYSTSKSNIIAKQNSTVKFDNISPKWCNNACLHYTAKRDTVIVDVSGTVWCSNQKQFICLMSTCYCNKLEHSLKTPVLHDTNIVIITDRLMTLSSAIKIDLVTHVTPYQRNISIIGRNNPTVICVNGGRLELHYHYYLIIEGIIWIGCGGHSDILTPVILIGSHAANQTDYTIAIQKCSFQHSIAPVVAYFQNKKNMNVNVNHCNFINGNHHRGQGVAIYFIPLYGKVTINNCNFSYNGFAKSIIYIKSFAKVYINNSNFFSNQGVPVYLSNYSILYIHGKVSFENNVAENGAGIYISDHSTILFDKNSIVKYNNNYASNGTIYSVASSNVIFKENCEVTFSNNSATRYGAAIYSVDNSHITFTGYSEVTFSSNNVSISESNADHQFGGTIFSEKNAHVYFEENSTTLFYNNIANFGAAIFSLYNSNITFKHNSLVKFINNTARCCGTLTSALFSTITFNDNTEVTFSANTVSYTPNLYDESLASALCSFKSTGIFFSGHSVITFFNNTANRGGAVVIFKSNVFVKEYSTVNFNSNIALYSSGGALECSNNTNFTIKGNSNVTFNNNKAGQNGGAIYSYNICQIIFKENSTSKFVNNNAKYNGGATLGSQLSSMIFEGNSTITFDNNTANNGGAICVSNKTNIIVEGSTTALFNYNVATEGGGAIEVANKSSILLKDDININFANNCAEYGGAIFLDKFTVMINSSNDERSIQFQNNKAKFKGNSVYLDITESCNSSCLNSKIIDIKNDLIITPPNVLKFYDPAICIDTDNDTQCNSYYVQNIMLGSEIIIPTCVLDYYNNVVMDSTQLMAHTESNSNYFNNVQKDILLSCNLFQRFRVMGNQTLATLQNYSINFSLNVDHNADWKQITTVLVIELSPCYLGFWQYPESQQCECYNANDIVFCSGNNSTIKRGYWFGNVTGKPTITFCPINYCDFTCCETTNGYYHLAPVRDNQCKSYRSGAACGGCTYGYTLSFDSTECVSLQSCTVGKMVLVIMLTVTYWIVMFALVFAMSYYSIGIGYLYCITYYYSILDILLIQNLQSNGELHLVVNIMSSFSKITPQFLGKHCLTPGMSGIDQQFIHYIHPPAITIILVAIITFGWKSQKISKIIGRGIIHAICLLLLLSYTSMASTSLLLIRALTFHGIDKVYTYLSPDIEYFHGRHLAYGIVALLCTVTIVIGLPLLLTVHPFINHKINFTRIKPILDQFQGCYKDKYRCFAGYYMICRLVIIIIVIVNSSNDFVAIYMLTFVSGVTALIHQIIKPYNKRILNNFDGIALQLIIFITALPLFSDDFNSPLAITLAYVLIFFPLLSFITISLFLHKDYFKKLSTHFALKNRTLSIVNKINNKDVNNNDVPMRKIDNSTYDSVRVNVTVCDL